jgi:hypothetical protein
VRRRKLKEESAGRRIEIRCAERTHSMRCCGSRYGSSSHFTSNPYRRHSIDLCVLYDNRAQEGLFKAGVDIPPSETHRARSEVRPAKLGKKRALFTSQRVLREQNCGGQGE